MLRGAGSKNEEEVYGGVSVQRECETGDGVCTGNYIGRNGFFARIPGFSGESGTCEWSADNTDDSPWRYAAGTQALLYR